MSSGTQLVYAYQSVQDLIFTCVLHITNHVNDQVNLFAHIMHFKHGTFKLLCRINKIIHMIQYNLSLCPV